MKDGIHVIDACMCEIERINGHPMFCFMCTGKVKCEVNVIDGKVTTTTKSNAITLDIVAGIINTKQNP